MDDERPTDETLAIPRNKEGEQEPPQKRCASGLSGRTLGHYEVLDEVGRGGMGVVYKGHDRALDRNVAIKVLLPHLSSNGDYAKRFLREARAAAKLDQSNIVQVYQAGMTDGVLFLAMQYIDADVLADVIDNDGAQSVPYALSIARQVAMALGVAHTEGIVHRDIKPSNIMVDQGGRVKVMDFGLAREIAPCRKITRTGDYIGTPEYSSPEQCETLEIDGRSDIYSLGIVLYEMLTGKVPFSADTPLTLFEKIRHEQPESIRHVAPDVGTDVERLVEKMIAKDPADRYQDCASLVADIERLERGEDVSIRKTKARRAQGRSLSGRLAAGIATGALLIASAVVAYTFLVGTPKPSESRSRLLVHDFANSTGSESVDWLRIGIADMLITDLAECEFLDVLSRDRVKALLAAQADDQTDGIVLKGSFLVISNRIRVMAQLVDGRTGSVIRAVRSEGSESEIFSIIDDISVQVRDGLQGVIAKRLGRPVDLAYADGRVLDRLFASSRMSEAEEASGAWANPEAESAVLGKDKVRLVRSTPPLPLLKSRAGQFTRERRSASKADATKLAIKKPVMVGATLPEDLRTSKPAETAADRSSFRGVAASETIAATGPVASPAPLRSPSEPIQKRNAKKAASPLPPLVIAMRLRYQAQQMSEGSNDIISLKKSLLLLERVERIAPAMRDLRDQIDQLRRRISEAVD